MVRSIPLEEGGSANRAISSPILATGGAVTGVLWACLKGIASYIFRPIVAIAELLAPTEFDRSDHVMVA